MIRSMDESQQLPQPFGRYVLREAIASGGMAEVFRATLPGFGGFEKQVAIKRMFRQFSDDPSFVEMLTDEAKIVSQLNHPNIAQILDFSQVEDDYYIALEYVPGVDLFRLLQRQFEVGQNLPVALSIYIVAELCSALDYAHARQTQAGDHLEIVHRDVSPQNVLAGFQGEVKLTDFGIAKAAYRYTQTQSGTVKGKLYYMSPEQARGDAIDHRSDLFAVGILMFELLCTQPLYSETDPEQLLVRVRTGEVNWPDSRRSELPTPLLEVVDRALAQDPNARFQTGREMRTHLLAAARSVGLLADRESLGAYLRALYEVSDKRPPSTIVARDMTMNTPHWSESQPKAVAVSAELEKALKGAVEPPANDVSMTADAAARASTPQQEAPGDDATSMLSLGEIENMLGAEPLDHKSQNIEAEPPTDIGHAQPKIVPAKPISSPSRKVRIPSTVIPEAPSVATATETQPLDPALPTTLPTGVDQVTVDVVDHNRPNELDATQIHVLDSAADRRFSRAVRAAVPQPPPRPSNLDVQPKAHAAAALATATEKPASWQLIAMTAAVWAGVVTLSMYSLLLWIR